MRARSGRKSRFDEYVHTVVIFPVAVICLAVLGADEREAFAHGIASARKHAPAAEVRDEFDVVHELFHVGKQAVIDALQNVVRLFAVRLRRHFEGVVDVPLAVTLTRGKRSLDLKLPDKVYQIKIFH